MTKHAGGDLSTSMLSRVGASATKYYILQTGSMLSRYGLVRNLYDYIAKDSLLSNNGSPTSAAWLALYWEVCHSSKIDCSLS